MSASPVPNQNEATHPAIVQHLGDAVMNWPIVTAGAGFALAIAAVGAFGWAVCGSLARLVG